MILFPHMLIGGAIGAKIHSYLAVFVLGIIGHFLADKIPHWEYLDKELSEFKSKKEWLVFLAIVILDFSVGALVIFYFFWQSPVWPYVIFGALISVLPDFLIFVNWLFPKIKLLTSYRNFHHQNHLSEKYRRRLALSFLGEGTVIFLAILYFIFRQS